MVRQWNFRHAEGGSELRCDEAHSSGPAFFEPPFEKVRNTDQSMTEARRSINEIREPEFTFPGNLRVIISEHRE
jgi:hypothetical protein